MDLETDSDGWFGGSGRRLKVKAEDSVASAPILESQVVLCAFRVHCAGSAATPRAVLEMQLLTIVGARRRAPCMTYDGPAGDREQVHFPLGDNLCVS